MAKTAILSGPPLTDGFAGCYASLRLRKPDRVTGDRAVREELAHLADGGVREGKDVVRRHELVVRHRLPRRPHQGHGGVQGRAERRLDVVADGRVEVLVQRGQLHGGVITDAELALAEDSHDHDPSPACCSAAGASCPALAEPLPSICLGALEAISPLIRASSESTSLLAPSLSSSAWMSSWPPPTWSSRAPEASSSSIAPA